jgi:hypothetical protein
LTRRHPLTTRMDDAWAAELGKAWNVHPVFQEVSSDWEWPVIVSFEEGPDPDGAVHPVYFDVYRGQCQEARLAVKEDIRNAVFIFSVDMSCGILEHDPDRSLEFAGHFKLRKGDMVTATQHARMFDVLLELAGQSLKRDVQETTILDPSSGTAVIRGRTGDLLRDAMPAGQENAGLAQAEEMDSIPQKIQTEPDGWHSFRERFRLWRRTRPFAGSVLILVAGVLILYGPLQLLQFAMLPGSDMWSAVTVGGVLFCMGIIQLLAPRFAVITGTIAIVLSLVSLITAMGGFIIGMILGLTGGALGVAWKPPSLVIPGSRDTALHNGPADFSLKSATVPPGVLSIDSMFRG